MVINDYAVDCQDAKMSVWQFGVLAFGFGVAAAIWTR
jgi:hypothetical protein